MRNWDIRKVQELYRVAMLLYDLGIRSDDNQINLSRYYIPSSVSLIRRMIKAIEEEEREKTEDFMKEFKKAESVIRGK